MEVPWGGWETILVPIPFRRARWVDFWGVGEPQLGLKPLKSLLGEGREGRKARQREGEGVA